MKNILYNNRNFSEEKLKVAQSKLPSVLSRYLAEKSMCDNILNQTKEMK